jgi:hypothetical protein
MASEDSVENVLRRDSSVLAVPIDGVGKPNQSGDPLERLVLASIDQLNSTREDLVVGHTRRKAHIPPKERNDGVSQDPSIRDLQDEHIFVPRFGEDAARPELCRSHLKKTPSVPVLIQEELRLDEVAESRAWMSLERDADAAFAFNEAG